MGYRSTAVYAIVFTTEEDKNRLLSRLPAEQLEILRSPNSGLQEEPTRLCFYETGIKWYSSSILPGVLEGYQVIDAHEALINAAKAAAIAEGSDNFIKQVGVFIRVGEDDSDIENDAWGYPGEDGLPEWYELAELRISVDVNW